jgi:CubicO group peptidase (beta-lactamase class C family)
MPPPTPVRTPRLRRVQSALAMAAVLAVGVLLGCRSAAAQPERSVAGEWSGAVRTPGGLLPMTLVLGHEAGAWSGTLSVPAEGVENMLLHEVRVAGDSATLTLRPEPALVMRLMLSGDSLAGTFHPPGASMPAVFGRPGSALVQRLEEERTLAMESARKRPLIERGPGPAAGSVNAAALDRLLRAGEASNSDAIVVLRDGRLVGEWYAGGQPRRIESMSATKSIVHLAVARLLTTGAIASLDLPVHTWYPEWNDGLKARVTLRHLLNHTSGLHADRTTEAIYASGDFVRHALDSEVTREPGTAYFYNNSATNLVAGIVGRAAGQPLDEFLRDDLFARLGITDFNWVRDAAGNPHGMSGLQILPADLAKLGQLVLDGGRYGDEQLIAADVIAEGMRAGSSLSSDTGLLWWLIHERAPDASRPAADAPVIGYYAAGFLGQFLVIYPEERLVAVRMVAPSPVYQAATDGFPDFNRLVRELAH